MMPRPILLENFNLTYRKIPVMCIGKEVRFYKFTSSLLPNPPLSIQLTNPPSAIHRHLPNPRSNSITSILPTLQGPPTSPPLAPTPNPHPPPIKPLHRPAPLPPNNRPNPPNSLANLLRNRPRQPNRPQTQPRQTRSQSPPKPRRAGHIPLHSRTTLLLNHRQPRFLTTMDLVSRNPDPNSSRYIPLLPTSLGHEDLPRRRNPRPHRRRHPRRLRRRNDPNLQRRSLPRPL